MIEAADKKDGEAKKDDTKKAYAYRCALKILCAPNAPADQNALQGKLEALGGEVRVSKTQTGAMEVEMQSDAPGNVLQAALEFGPITNVTVENLKEGQPLESDAPKAEETPEEKTEAPEAPKLERVEPEKEYGFVAVAAGAGVIELFKELGADVVVSGGQTMNPSTDDILQAVEATPARHVFVLPNNKNIIMAAEQAVHLADRGVSVVATKTIPQGITAMLSFEDGVSPEENHLQMMKAAEGVHTAQVTFAARDSEVSGERIKKGQLLGMEDGKITLVEDDLVNAAYRVTRRLVKKYNGSLITILYGADTDEATAQALAERLQARFPSVEINVINGGQPVYYFLAAVE